MTRTKSFLLFRVGEGRYALDVADVERIVFAAGLAPLADAPAHVLGLVNIAGEIMPVVDVRRRLGLPARDMDLSDRLIVSRAAGAPTALLVEAVEGVVDLPVQPLTEGAGPDRWTATAAVAADGALVEIYSASTLVSAPDSATSERAVRSAYA